METELLLFGPTLIFNIKMYNLIVFNYIIYPFEMVKFTISIFVSTFISFYFFCISVLQLTVFPLSNSRFKFNFLSIRFSVFQCSSVIIQRDIFRKMKSKFLI